MKAILRDLFICAKPGLSFLVVLTYLMGVLLALPVAGSINLLSSLGALLGTTLLVAGANVWNCWLERDIDPYMSRTKNRPLVTGSLSPEAAVAGATALTVIGLALIYSCSNMTTFIWGCAALGAYVALYTPLKRFSTLALFVGAVPGAIPPVMGWTSIRGELGLAAHILFWIMFLWQLPHFISIAIYRRDEYELAGLKTLPLKIGIYPAKWHMFLYAALLVSVSFLPYFLDLAGAVYMGAALLVGIAFLWFCVESLLESSGSRATRRVFFASVGYLPLTLGVWAIEWLVRSLSR